MANATGNLHFKEGRVAQNKVKEILCIYIITYIYIPTYTNLHRYNFHIILIIFSLKSLAIWEKDIVLCMSPFHQGTISQSRIKILKMSHFFFKIFESFDSILKIFWIHFQPGQLLGKYKNQSTWIFFPLSTSVTILLFQYYKVMVFESIKGSSGN